MRSVQAVWKSIGRWSLPPLVRVRGLAALFDAIRLGMDTNTSIAQDVARPEVPDELLTQRELARRLKVCERKVQGDKALPRIIYGRNVRYSWPAVLAYLEQVTEVHAMEHGN